MDDLSEGDLVETSLNDDSTIENGNGSILQSSHNNTMSYFAGRVLKKLGNCNKAQEAYIERAAKSDPPLLQILVKRVFFLENALENYVLPVLLITSPSRVIDGMKINKKHSVL